MTTITRRAVLASASAPALLAVPALPTPANVLMSARSDFPDRIHAMIAELRWLPRDIPWSGYHLAQIIADELERAISPDRYDRSTEHFTNRYLRDSEAMKQGRWPS